MDMDTQKNDIYSGVRWSAVATYGCQTVQFITTMVMARLLAPEYFGLLAMAQVFVGFAHTFSTMGFSQAIIQRKQITEELLSSLFFVTLAFGCLIAVILACASPVFGWIYGNAEVSPIIAALSLAFILRAPCLVPAALLTRRMAFNRLAVIDVSAATFTATASISLAWYGWGVWALVWPTVFEPLLRIPMVYLAAGWRPRLLFRWTEVRSVLGFGANLTGVVVVSYFRDQADKFLIGSFLGATTLGYYSLAYGVLRRPREAVTGVVTRVLFPAFARMQDDDARLKAAYLRACGAVAFATFPMMLGFIVLARPFIEVCFGAKWLPALPLIYVLAPVGMMQSVGWVQGQLFLAKGRADWHFRVVLVTAPLICCSYIVGLQWGVLGVAVSYAVTVYVLSLPSHWVAFRLVDGLRLRDLLAVLTPCLGAAAFMVTIVVIARIALERAGVGNVIVLPAVVSLGVVSYVLAALAIRVRALHDLFRLASTGSRLRSTDQ